MRVPAQSLGWSSLCACAEAAVCCKPVDHELASQGLQEHCRVTQLMHHALQSHVAHALQSRAAHALQSHAAHALQSRSCSLATPEGREGAQQRTWAQNDHHRNDLGATLHMLHFASHTNVVTYFQLMAQLEARSTGRRIYSDCFAARFVSVLKA